MAHSVYRTLRGDDSRFARAELPDRLPCRHRRWTRPLHLRDWRRSASSQRESIASFPRTAGSIKGTRRRDCIRIHSVIGRRRFALLDLSHSSMFDPHEHRGAASTWPLSPFDRAARCHIPRRRNQPLATPCAKSTRAARRSPDCSTASARPSARGTTAAAPRRPTSRGSAATSSSTASATRRDGRAGGHAVPDSLAVEGQVAASTQNQALSALAVPLPRGARAASCRGSTTSSAPSARSGCPSS